MKALCELQVKSYSLQKNGIFKSTPPGIDTSIVRRKKSKTYEKEKCSRGGYE